jgi:hypothetical protein
MLKALGFELVHPASAYDRLAIPDHILNIQEFEQRIRRSRLRKRHIRDHCIIWLFEWIYWPKAKDGEGFAIFSIFFDFCNFAYFSMSYRHLDALCDIYGLEQIERDSLEKTLSDFDGPESLFYLESAPGNKPVEDLLPVSQRFVSAGGGHNSAFDSIFLQNRSIFS